ncbi:hypothetical protein ACFOEE_01880 [Pseudoalteromonas fenneropenaei]|uniref:Lipoprotein n=1 Tax=Pseudoalteromonas fenneropenaei TaxID=1737459 RepID=A0ABV7CF87_9GAMM
MLKQAVGIIIPLTLLGCSSEDLETTNFGSDLYKNNYYLVNASGTEVAFHLANTEVDGDERDASNNKYWVQTLTAGADVVKTKHEHNVAQKVTFYAESRNPAGKSAKVTEKVKTDKDYNVIAWQDSNGAFGINVLRREQSNRSGQFAVRFFALDAQQVIVNGTTMTLARAGISEWYYIDECGQDIVVAGQRLDICQGSYNNSYLLVVGQQGLIAQVNQS